MKTVQVIVPVKKVYNDGSNKVLAKKRVAAYARVSTDYEDQINSFHAQVDEYTKRINSQPDWEFVGMYADQGLTGTQMKKRPEFMRMIDSARRGNIDLILVKSISRFARNTVDILNTIRELRAVGCIIYFEKENLYSDDSKIDFTLTILSSIAQEESRSISSNVKWAVEKKFKQGKVIVGRIYGYRFGENKAFIIHDEEAKVVRLIYSLFIQGYSIQDIKHILNNRGIVPASSKSKTWPYSTIRNILMNEKYCGDAILQKTVTLDYLTHKAVINDNIVNKYFVENNHEGIVSKEEWETAQYLLKGQSSSLTRMATKHSLTNLVYCSECGRNMHRHSINHNRPSVTTVLDCKHNPVIEKKCSTKWVSYDLVEKAIKDSIVELISRPELIESVTSLLAVNNDVDILQNEMATLREQIAKIQKAKTESVDSALVLKLENQENSLVERIKAKQKLVSSRVKTNTILDLISGLLANKEIEIDGIIIKTLYRIVVSSNDTLTLVISNAPVTHEIALDIEKYVNIEPLFTKLFVDEESQRGIYIKVVFYDETI